MVSLRKNLSVTLIGSFRRKPEELRKLFDYLSSTYTLLSPLDIDWLNQNEEFVKTDIEAGKPIMEIEAKHLAAIRNSDLVFLFAPDGYVGLSGSFEIGYALAAGVPVIATSPLSDIMLKSIVTTQVKPEELADEYPKVLSGNGLMTLQQYYARISKRRGWNKETATDTLLLLTEELGELARAIRKHEELRRDKVYEGNVSEEIADIQLYLVHLANILNVDLGKAVTEKEKVNEERFSSYS